MPVSQFEMSVPSDVPSGIYHVLKHRSETLAALLERFRYEHGFQNDVKMTYAGRLDPMAEGLVLVLVGETRFQKDTLLNLEKVYEMEIMFGISTDTQDVLGKITEINFKNIDEENIRSVITGTLSLTSLPYPMYSSTPVDGKPLFVHARAGNDVVAPQKKIKISKIEVLSIRKEKINIETIVQDISKVEGDFRQADIILDWQKIEQVEVVFAKIRAKVSSGTYMRSLAKHIGEILLVPALAYSIKRLSIGDFDLKE